MDKHKYIIGVLVGLIGLYLILVVGLDYGSTTVDDSYKIKNEQLEQEKENLTLEIQAQDLKIEEFLKEEKKIDQGVDFKKIERTVIKEDIYETINDIDSSDNNELYGFFANFKTNGIND